MPRAPCREEKWRKIFVGPLLNLLIAGQILHLYQRLFRWDPICRQDVWISHHSPQMGISFQISYRTRITLWCCHLLGLTIEDGQKKIMLLVLHLRFFLQNPILNINGHQSVHMTVSDAPIDDRKIQCFTDWNVHAVRSTWSQIYLYGFVAWWGGVVRYYCSTVLQSSTVLL